MNLNEHLLNVVVAVVVAAVTTAGTSYLVLRYTPASMDQQRVERIMRDYLTKNPQILVEMATQLDKRQASQQTKAISDNADAIFRFELYPALPDDLFDQLKARSPRSGRRVVQAPVDEGQRGQSQ